MFLITDDMNPLKKFFILMLNDEINDFWETYFSYDAYELNYIHMKQCIENQQNRYKRAICEELKYTPASIWHMMENGQENAFKLLGY